ncbi:MAG: carboxypeptidase regulatory-like domain-containing protein [Candidatus Zixiibacteriota bacterium]|nr:MAG: carboxypeptidase regulatory-like domain-containing protein [candidate division Zixibacteria bacterium]
MKILRKPLAMLALGISAIILFPVSAFSGALTGTVIDNVIFNPVPDVEVSVFQSDSTLAGTDTTDINGIYALTLDAGEYYAFFSKQNYADTTISGIIIVPQDTTVIDLTFRFLQNCDYVPGDANNDGVFNGYDITFLIAWLKGGPPPPYSCECRPGWIWWPAVDYNCSCSNPNGLDITFIIAYFKGGHGQLACPCPDCPPIN